MQYNFNTPVERIDSVKYGALKARFGADEDVIPMWIADMDIVTPALIIEALEQRAKAGGFGYTRRPEEYDNAIISWHKERNNWNINPRLMSYCVGVVHAIGALISEFSQKGDKILFFTPAYHMFSRTIMEWDRTPLTSSLIETEAGYAIDFTDFENKLKEKPAMVIICNPHNPVGEVWSREELTKIGRLATQYGVLIISDEIHSDLTLWGKKYQPMGLLDKEITDNLIICTSLSKTFNLAGLQASSVIFNNEENKDKFDTFWRRCGITGSNCFAHTAVIAAIQCGDWLEQALKHLESNLLFAQDFLRENIPGLSFKMPQSTYLVWLDCRKLGLNQEELEEFMITKAKLALNSGTEFGPEGEGFMRLNVACTRPVLEKALEQLRDAVNSIS